MPGHAIDALVRTPAEVECLDLLRSLAGAEDGPLERHSTRLFLIAEVLGERGGHESDREVVLCAAILHDIGLYVDGRGSTAYVTVGRDLTDDLTARLGWPADRALLLADAVELHHEPFAQWEHGVEVELIRRADLVEVSQGLIRFGVPRAWLKDLRRRVPVDGMVGEIVSRLRGSLLRPKAIWGIFRPPDRTPPAA